MKVFMRSTRMTSGRSTNKRCGRPSMSTSRIRSRRSSRSGKGFGPSRFAQTVDPENGQPRYDYAKDGFAATAYQLSTDQLGTQLDPPAHGNPDYPSIDELPPTVCGTTFSRDLNCPQSCEKIRSMLCKCRTSSTGRRNTARSRKAVSYSCGATWSRKWPDPSLATNPDFPGVSLAALKFMHLQRKIYFMVMNLWIRTPRQLWKARPGFCATVIHRPKPLQT